MNTFKFWAAFSIGVAAGAVITLLCAPQSGDKTRKQLLQKLDDAGDYIKDTASDLGEKASSAYQRGKGSLSDYSDDLTERAQSAVKSAKAQF